MNQSNLAAYLSTGSPRSETTVLQIVELYHAGYISLASAKGLATRHAPELSDHVNWQTVQRIPAIVKGSS